MYAPGLAGIVPPMVSPVTFGLSEIADERATATTAGSSTWDATNGAVFYPVIVPATCVVRRLFWVNGTVNGSYNLDAAVYADAGYAPGARLVSAGSTAQAGNNNEIQFVDVADTVLTPGRYWLAMAASSTSVSAWRTILAVGGQNRRYRQFTAMPLPATANASFASADTTVWIVGFSTRTSP